jgi:hypothetical protein
MDTAPIVSHIAQRKRQGANFIFVYDGQVLGFGGHTLRRVSVVAHTPSSHLPRENPNRR